jgi:mRNA interferase MazF
MIRFLRMTPKRGDVIVASLSPRQGTEAGKNRPVIVVQSDPFIRGGQRSTTICPCTTQLVAPGNELRVRIPEGITKRTTDILVDQARTIDNNRLSKHIGRLPEATIAELDAKLRNFLGL